MAAASNSAVPSGSTDAGPHLAELEAVYRQAPVGLATIDRELRYRRVNEQLAAMNGRSVEEHIGRTVREIVPEVADEIERIARRVLETGAPVRDLPLSAETAMQPGVVRHWIEQWYPLVDATGVVVGVNIVVEEITAGKALEGRGSTFALTLPPA